MDIAMKKHSYLLRQYTRIFFFLLIGIILFSPYVNILFTQEWGINHTYIEFFIIPLFIAFRKHFKFKIINIILSLLFLILFTLLGTLNTNFTLTQILYTSRSYTLILFFFLCFKNHPILTINDLYYLSLGSILGSIIVSSNNFLNIEVLENTGFSYIVDMNVLSIPLCISSALLTKKLPIILFTVFITLIGAYLSVTRGLLLFFILSLIISMLFAYKKRKAIVRILFICSIGLLSLTLVAYYNLENKVYDMSPTIHNRLYTKIRNGSTGDDGRIRHLIYIADNLDSYILPRGFVYRKTDNLKKHRDLWMVQDIALGELLYTFGFLFIFLLIWYLNKYISLLKTKWRNSNIVLVCTMATAFIIFIFFGYGILIHPYSVCLLGIFLAFLYNPQNIICQTKSRVHLNKKRP